MTPNLRLSHFTGPITGFFTLLSDVFDGLDRATQGVVSIDIQDADRVLSEDEFRSAGEYRIAGATSAARQITLPSSLRRRCDFVNGGAQAITVAYAGGGASVTIPAGESRSITADGVGVLERLAGLGNSPFPIENASGVVAGAASFLRFVGDVTVTQSLDGVEVNLSSPTDGIALREGGELVRSLTTAIDFSSSLFDLTDNGDGSVTVSLAGFSVDEDGNTTGVPAAIPVLRDGQEVVQQAVSLDFVGGFELTETEGAVQIRRPAFPVLRDGQQVVQRAVSFDFVGGFQVTETDGVVQIRSPTGQGSASGIIERSVRSADYVLTAADRGRLVEVTAAATITIPPQVFNDGDFIAISRFTADTVTIAGGSGVILNRAPQGTLTITNDLSGGTLRCRGNDEFVMEGTVS